MSKHTYIAVLESRWWQEKNTSVRGLFDLVADISCGNPHRYHYEMANSEVAIKEAIPRIGSYTNCRYLYIAAHGDHDGLYLGNEEKLTRAELRNCLLRMGDGIDNRVHGLHLGSCIFGSESLAKFMFERKVRVTWFSGYSETVNWIDSSALDLLFFNQLAGLNDKFLPGITIKKVATRLLRLAPGLIKKLGFGIYVRVGRRGEIRNLLSSAYGQGS